MTVKILFVRGKGSDVDPVWDGQITRATLQLSRVRLSRILHPYEVHMAPLDGTAFRQVWMPTLESLDLLSYDVIIGHSSGVQAVLRLAERKPLRHVLLVSATDQHNHTRSEMATGWFDTPWAYDDIRNNCSKIIICNGRNDPFIDPAEAISLGEKLNAPVYLMKDAGHLSSLYHSHIFDKIGVARTNVFLKQLVDELLEKQPDTQTKRRIF